MLSEETDNEDKTFMSSERTIKKYQVYRHYKGALYTVIELAINEETNDLMVVYAGETGVWVRPIKSFGAILGDSKEGTNFYRFQLEVSSDA